MALWEEKCETYKQYTLSMSNAIRRSRLNHYRRKMEEILQYCIVASSNVAIFLHELMRFDLNF